MESDACRSRLPPGILRHEGHRNAPAARRTLASAITGSARHRVRQARQPRQFDRYVRDLPQEYGPMGEGSLQVGRNKESSREDLPLSQIRDLLNNLRKQTEDIQKWTSEKLKGEPVPNPSLPEPLPPPVQP